MAVTLAGHYEMDLMTTCGLERRFTNRKALLREMVFKGLTSDDAAVKE
jgi:hypothetical protein